MVRFGSTDHDIFISPQQYNHHVDARTAAFDALTMNDSTMLHYYGVLVEEWIPGVVGREENV